MGKMTDHKQSAIRCDRKGDVLWVWIDRAERRNAINADVLAGIGAAIEQSLADSSLRALVLTGVGDKAFCAGADLTDGPGTFQAAADEPTTDFGRLARLVRRVGIPLIARVNGACIAGGMGLMALCDLAIAAEHARFGLPEVRVGVFPMQVLTLLRATVHARHLNQLCLTGEQISAARAADIGLINEVAAVGELDARVDAVIQQLRSASPTAIRRGKHALFAMEHMAFDEAIAFAEAQIALASRSSDAAEGLQAFNEKRKPRWLGES